LKCGVTIPQEDVSVPIAISDRQVQALITVEVGSYNGSGGARYRVVHSLLEGAISLAQQDAYVVAVRNGQVQITVMIEIIDYDLIGTRRKRHVRPARESPISLSNKETQRGPATDDQIRYAVVVKITHRYRSGRGGSDIKRCPAESAVALAKQYVDRTCKSICYRNIKNTVAVEIRDGHGVWARPDCVIRPIKEIALSAGAGWQTKHNKANDEEPDIEFRSKSHNATSASDA
jgi:hypothetical protein